MLSLCTNLSTTILSYSGTPLQKKVSILAKMSGVHLHASKLFLGKEMAGELRGSEVNYVVHFPFAKVKNFAFTT